MDVEPTFEQKSPHDHPHCSAAATLPSSSPGSKWVAQRSNTGASCGKTACESMLVSTNTEGLQDKCRDRLDTI